MRNYRTYKSINNLKDDSILGYDCDGNEINQFRILRFPFSSGIENWDDETNIDPRLYCLVKSSCNEVFAISVYDDWYPERIRKYERLDIDVSIPMLIKSKFDMQYYEVAFNGITGDEWYYDRCKEELIKALDLALMKQNENTKSLVKKYK